MSVSEKTDVQKTLWLSLWCGQRTVHCKKKEREMTGGARLLPHEHEQHLTKTSYYQEAFILQHPWNGVGCMHGTEEGMMASACVVTLRSFFLHCTVRWPHHSDSQSVFCTSVFSETDMAYILVFFPSVRVDHPWTCAHARTFYCVLDSCQMVFECSSTLHLSAHLAVVATRLFFQLGCQIGKMRGL